jgi:hypothetical protein
MNMKTLTPKLHNKLRILNDKLAQIELMIIKKAKEIDKKMRAECLHKKDNLHYCSLEVYLYFYTDLENDKCVAEWFEQMDGVCKGRNCFLADRGSHNDLHRFDHPIRDDYHCWLFHSLYDHKYLSWKKMAEIKDVHWIIRPEYNYGVELSELCND